MPCKSIIIPVLLGLATFFAINATLLITVILRLAHQYDTHSLTGGAVAWAVVLIVFREILAGLAGLLVGVTARLLWPKRYRHD